MNSRIVFAFRIIAVVEALTWLGLLIGMYFKWIAQTGEVGVKVFGPIHGAVFVAYLVVALLTSAGAALVRVDDRAGPGRSVPPFCTVWFETWAKRTGRLEPAKQTGVAVAA